VKNTRVLSQTKKNILSTSKQNKTNQTRPDQQPPKKRTEEKRNHPLPPLTADNKLPLLDHHTIMRLNGRSEQLRTIHNTGRNFL
jgi:hypothetical protein